MRFIQFGGMIPKLAPYRLQEDASALSVNTDNYNGLLTPLYYPERKQTLLDIFGEPFVGKPANITKIGSVWVGWETYTFTAPDISKRIGETSTLFVMNNTLYRQSAERILTKKPPIMVGIRRPSSDEKERPTAEVIEDAGCAREEFPLDCVPRNDNTCDSSAFPPEATAYVFTYVNGCQEESAVSIPTNMVDFMQGDAIHVHFNDNPPDNAVARRVYRAVSDSEGNTVYLFVGQSDIGNRDYYDTACADGLGGVLQTEEHDAPPDCIEGVSLLGDNTTLLWGGKRIFLSQPNLPHAYDIRHEFKLRYPIFGVYHTTSEIEGKDTYFDLVVCDGLNYIINGTGEPGVLNISEVQSRYFAYGPHSVARTEAGLVFVCKQGICDFSERGIQLLTGDFMTEIEWDYYQPREKQLCYHDDNLITAGNGKNIKIVLGSDKRRKANFCEHTYQIDAISNTELDELAIAYNGNVYGLDNPRRPMRYTWRSPTMTLAGEWRPVFVKVMSPQFVVIPPDVGNVRVKYQQWVRYNKGLVLEDFIEEFPEYAKYYNFLAKTVPSVEVILYADGKEYYRRIVESGKPFLIPRKHKAFDWSVEITGNIVVSEVHIQSSREQLLGGE